MLTGKKNFLTGKLSFPYYLFFDYPQPGQAGTKKDWLVREIPNPKFQIPTLIRVDLPVNFRSWFSPGNFKFTSMAQIFITTLVNRKKMYLQYAKAVLT